MRFPKKLKWVLVTLVVVLIAVPAFLILKGQIHQEELDMLSVRINASGGSFDHKPSTLSNFLRKCSTFFGHTFALTDFDFITIGVPSRGFKFTDDELFTLNKAHQVTKLDFLPDLRLGFMPHSSEQVHRFQSMTWLEYLALSPTNLRSISDLSKFPSITTLNLRKFHIDKEMVKVINNCPSLKTLIFIDCTFDQNLNYAIGKAKINKVVFDSNSCLGSPTTLNVAADWLTPALNEVKLTKKR